jgi:hypothetical protein
MKLKQFLGVGLAIAMMAPVGVLAAQPAGAAAIVTCAPPSGTVTFTPGLSSTPKIQTTSFNLPIKNCKGGGVTGGTSKGSTKGTKPQTCATFATNPSAANTKVTITWNTGKTSVSVLATKVSSSNGSLIATVSGKVTSGTAFVGKTLKTKVKVTLKGKCTPSAPLKQAVLTGLAPFTVS